jgi:hypothetical protein
LRICQVPKIVNLEAIVTITVRIKRPFQSACLSIVKKKMPKGRTVDPYPKKGLVTFHMAWISIQSARVAKVIQAKQTGMLPPEN